MSRVWVLGSGQLGAMLARAGQALGIDTRPIPFNAELSTLDDISTNDIVTPEIEAWPENKITKLLSSHPGLNNIDVFPLVADRLTQKQALDRFDVATADWSPVEKTTTAKQLHAQLGDQVLLKKRKGGYDGRGQFWLIEDEESEIPNEFLGESIAETAVPFSDEVSIIGCRDQQGNLRFYPPSLNLHKNGILKASIAGLNLPERIIVQAENMLEKVMTKLDYVGVMAMECFVVDYQLVVNELAPRVHNSGHWTQAGSSICQFESHIRAISGLPIGRPRQKGLTVMLNLIGMELNRDWYDIEGAEITWYGKEVRKGRKLGHMNICQPSFKTLENISDTLPKQDLKVIQWVIESMQRFPAEAKV